MGMIGTPQLVSESSSINGDWKRSGSRVYRAWATTDYSSVKVRQNCGIAPYNTHPDDTGMLVLDVQVDPDPPLKVAYDSDANPGGAVSPPTNGTYVYQWRITAEYGPWNPIEHTATGDPTAQPLEIKMNGVNYEQIVNYDLLGTPVVNTAGDGFDPPVIRDQVRCILEVTRNEYGFSPSTIFAYANRINAEVWNGFPALTVKISPPSVVPQYSQYSELLYSRVTYTFEYDPDTWVKQILNQGTRYLLYGNNGGGGYGSGNIPGGGSSSSGAGSSSSGIGPIRPFGGSGGNQGNWAKVNARDYNGDIATSPVLLDQYGQLLQLPADPVQLNFMIYGPMDFTVLGLSSIFTY